MRVLKNILLAVVVVFFVGSVGFVFWIRDRYVVPILMYHHVGIPSGKWRLNTVSEKSFDYQMNFLKRHGFQVISFNDLVTGLKEGHEFSRNTVVVQFDDGYEDNYQYAFPILKKYDLPAMIFLVSDKVNSPDFLTWDQVKEMERGNISFGAHTRTHVYLPRVDLAQAKDEIAGSKKMIEDHLGHSIDYFCYPSGGFIQEDERLVLEAGYKAAVTTNRGKGKYNTDLYALKRIHMNNTDDQYSGLILWFKLSGYYNLFRGSKPAAEHTKGFYMSKPYYLDDSGAFVIEDYQHAKLFSDFFPGVSGLYGIPMWAFYVNRGQGVSSFGIESKDKAILEFQPANKAYRLSSLQGFRTFLKVGHGKQHKFYEPFANSLVSSYKVHQRMLITSHDLTIEEINTTMGLKVTVNYFTLPQEPFAGLVRRVTIENIGRKPLNIQWVDGLPVINPYGLKDWLSKNMSRTVEAWMTVHNIKNKAPFYQLKVEVADTPQVTPISEGNFYFAFDADSRKLLDMVVEPSCVFGHASDFLVPENFIKQSNFQVPSRQETTNRTPSAMSVGRFVLGAGKKRGITAIAGFVHDMAELKKVVKKSTAQGFIENKARANRQIIDEIKAHCFTRSASDEFNQYCGQTFLDNILRGGLPISLQTLEGPVSFNVYSRKHGDPERDYNFFMLSPTFLSQGNGNYRDVNQNRRNDVWFNGDVKDSNLVNFLNLIQADGYNPLIVKGTIFVIKDETAIEGILNKFDVVKGADKLKEILKKGFMPGDLLKLITREIPIKGQVDEFLTKVLGVCAKHESAEPGEGFWSDHWTYNLDLVQSYLALYPEKLRELFWERRVFNFFLNDFYVLPREVRYVLTPAGVRQYHSLAEHDKEVQAKAKGYKLRGKEGHGEVYSTNLLVKLICLLANKASTLDPSGIGIEMEANKPNWYDALNGLPGLLGSSISETFELKRFAVFVKEAIQQLRLNDQATVMAFEELTDFVQGLTSVLSMEADPLKYWQKSNDLKEHFRLTIRYGIRGQEKPLSIAEIKKFLDGIIEKCDTGVRKARYNNGLFATYFYHEVIEYDLLDKSHHGKEHVSPKVFKRHDLPLFLEGFVHALRTEDNSLEAKALYKAVRSSKLFDRKLSMYKVNADISKESDEIGRTRIFPAGWLENESVWLHMEYKYLLELLRGGLAQEFFSEIKGILVPFLDPATYGRSILQNSSFIASSAHEDKNLHGQGFVARLSGSTAEFLHMWLVMNLGVKPFALDGQERLTLSFDPLLPSWLFTNKTQEGSKACTYSFKLFSKIMVTYHNPRLKDTFGGQGVKAQKMVLTYPDRNRVEITGGVLTQDHALDVREGRLKSIDVYFN